MTIILLFCYFYYYFFNDRSAKACRREYYQNEAKCKYLQWHLFTDLYVIIIIIIIIIIIKCIYIAQNRVMQLMRSWTRPHSLVEEQWTGVETKSFVSLMYSVTGGNINNNIP